MSFAGKSAFRLYDTFGFPVEFTVELARERGFSVDMEGYEAAFKKHQEKSHAGAEQRFKGGLADTGEQTAKLHTATHLLLACLKKVLDPNIIQKGSNITAERLRFDFNFPRPVTKEELAEIEKLVNQAIAEKIPVVCEELPIEEARKAGATGIFDSKYGDVVKVYTIEGWFQGNLRRAACGEYRGFGQLQDQKGAELFGWRAPDQGSHCRARGLKTARIKRREAASLFFAKKRRKGRILERFSPF